MGFRKLALPAGLDPAFGAAAPPRQTRASGGDPVGAWPLCYGSEKAGAGGRMSPAPEETGTTTTRRGETAPSIYGAKRPFLPTNFDF